MELKDSRHNQAYPTDLQDRICEGASNIIGKIKLKQTVPKILFAFKLLYCAVWTLTGGNWQNSWHVPAMKFIGMKQLF